MAAVGSFLFTFALVFIYSLPTIFFFLSQRVSHVSEACTVYVSCLDYFHFPAAAADDWSIT
jgi:hypothetical protein